MRLKNEALVGLTVMAGILTAVIGAVWMSGQSWGQTEREVVASFARVGALAEGNPVTYRGVNVGRVRKIELSPRGTGVYVTLGVRQGVELEGDAGVVLAPASLFGDWQAEIVSQAQYPELVFTGAPRADVLPGATLPDISELTAVAARIATDIEVLSERIQIAFTPETAVKIRSTIERVEEVSQQLSGFIDVQTRTYDQVGRNVLTSTENIRGATAAAQSTMQDVRVSLQSGDVQQVLANAREATSNLNALTVELRSAAGGVPGLVARADRTLGAFGETADNLNQTIAGVRPGLAEIGPTIADARQTLTNFNALLAQLSSQEGTVGRLMSDPALYEEFQRLVATMQRLMADIQANPAKYIREVQIF
jgi:phospholipid/cholesterol/gamma-HCH transport system substrate-binding protein